MLLADSYMLFKVICSLIRNPSVVSASFLHFAAQRSTVAPTVAPTVASAVGVRQLPEHLRETTKHSFIIYFVSNRSGTYNVVVVDF